MDAWQRVTLVIEGNDGEVEPKRKIPREEWQAISARHAGGESLASIARAYDCTPPAIRYIVRQAKKSGLDIGDSPADVTSLPMRADADEVGPDRLTEGRFAFPGRLRAAGELAALSSTEASFDFSLREAMTLEVSAFLVAFDAVVAQPRAETFDRLREATDRLLRAAARIRIELERMPAARGARSTGRVGTRGKT